jgi:ketosteroid isomerase-like protein
MTALIAVSVSSCNKPAPAKPAVDTAKIADAVKADVAQLVAEFNAHDAVKTARHNAEGAVVMFHGQPNTIASASKPPPPPDPSVTVTVANESVDVPASGDMAVYHSTYVANLTDPQTKKPVTESGNYLAGYKLQADGSWKQTWSVVSNAAPAPAAAAAAPPAK